MNVGNTPQTYDQYLCLGQYLCQKNHRYVHITIQSCRHLKLLYMLIATLKLQKSLDLLQGCLLYDSEKKHRQYCIKTLFLKIL